MARVLALLAKERSRVVQVSFSCFCRTLDISSSPLSCITKSGLSG